MKIIFLLVFLSLSIYAQTINEQIHSLEHATPKERVSLMNSIKQKLVMMNEDERVQTLTVLKARIHRERAEEHNYNQQRENINAPQQHDNHEMMHQGERASHTSEHGDKTDTKGHSEEHTKRPIKHSEIHDNAHKRDGRGR